MTNHITDDLAPPAPQTFIPESGLLWTSTEGQISNVSAFLVCLLLCWLIAPLFYALFRFATTFCHVYTVSDQRLRESTGIFFRQTEDLELYRVKDISVQEPLLQRLFGRGRVILLTSDRSTSTVVLNAIRDPLAVADLLRTSIERCRIAKGVREID